MKELWGIKIELIYTTIRCLGQERSHCSSYVLRFFMWRVKVLVNFRL